VLLGIQVPPEEDEEFKAAGGQGLGRCLRFADPFSACCAVPASSCSLPQTPPWPPACSSSVNPPACLPAPAVAGLSSDFTFTEIGGKAREVFKMFIS